MNLYGIADYLQTKKVGILGREIFVNEMPIEVAKGVLVRDRYSGTPFEHELPGYFATGFRVAVRSREFVEGDQLAWQVCDLLTIQTDTAMLGMGVKQVLPIYQPRPYKRSKGGFWEWELDFDIFYTKN